MSNFYIYRINVGYDGFYPQDIYERSKQDQFLYNWRAYKDNIEKGDIVLAYFLGSGCKDGIFAVTLVDKIKPGKKDGNVIADILFASTENRAPIIAKNNYKEIFKKIMYRPRGSEIVLSANNENEILSLLNQSKGLTDQLSKLGVSLPGILLPSQFDIDSIPMLTLKTDVAAKLKGLDIISVFWIRPRQSSWMKSIPWLSKISSLFYKFKSGDTSFIEKFSQKLSEQISNCINDVEEKFSYIIGVPLCEQKREYGEIDRVALLCWNLSKLIGIPYLKLLKLNGDISRTNYKRLRFSTERFVNDYTTSLEYIKRDVSKIKNCSGNIILVDDVYTDGVTTNTVVNCLRKIIESKNINIYIVTLGIMAKVNNISSKLRNSWRI